MIETKDLIFTLSLWFNFFFGIPGLVMLIEYFRKDKDNDIQE